MANPVIGELVDATNEAQTVMESATVALNGVADRIQVAVDAALANGATAEQLEPITTEVAELKAASAALAAAVVNSNPAE